MFWYKTSGELIQDRTETVVAMHAALERKVIISSEKVIRKMNYVLPAHVLGCEVT